MYYINLHIHKYNEIYLRIKRFLVINLLLYIVITISKVFFVVQIKFIYY